MKKQSTFLLSIPAVALATGILLLVPFAAMQFSEDVKWSALDFIIAGALIFSTGSALVLILRLNNNIVYKAAFGLSIGTTFLMIWVNLAVGLIGAGPNPANLMYIGVVAVLIGGVYLSHFKAARLEMAMFATAFSLVLFAAIALVARLDQLPHSSAMEIIVVNLFFGGLYTVSGLLFRHVALGHSSPAE